VISFLRTKNGRSAVVLLVAAMVVGALLVGPLGNRPPSAVMTIEGIAIADGRAEVVDGHVYTFRATDSNDPDGRVVRYRWDFDPECFTIVEGRTGDSIISGYFHCGNVPGTGVVQGPVERAITLTVEDNMGARSSVTVTFSVEPLVVGPEPERLGDSANWTVSGVMTVSNPDGLFDIEPDGIITISDTVITVQLTFRGTVTSWVAEPDHDIEDGFLYEHPVYTRLNDFDLKIVEGDDKSYTWTENGRKYLVRDTSGVTGRMSTHIYHPENRAVRLDMRVRSGNLDVGELFKKTLTIKGDVTGYPFLNTSDSVLHISDIQESIDADDWGVITVGDGTATWSVEDVHPVRVGAEWIPAFEVSVTLDSLEQEEDPPTITYYIGDGCPYPLRTEMTLQRMRDGTIVNSEITRTLVDFRTGTGPLPDATSEFMYRVTGKRYYNATEWAQDSGTPYNPPVVDFEDDHGGEDGHGFYEDTMNNQQMYQDDDSLQTTGAISRARDEDPQLDDYLDQHPDAYIVLSQYNETGTSKYPDLKRWNLTWGVVGSDDYYNVEILNRKRDGQNYTTRNSARLLRDTGHVLEQGREDVGKVLAFASAVHRMYLLGERYPEIRDELFLTDGRFDFQEASVGATIGVPYAMPLSLISEQRTTYAYYGINVTRKLSVFIDATNGQVMYFSENQGDLDLLWLLQALAGT